MGEGHAPLDPPWRRRCVRGCRYSLRAVRQGNATRETSWAVGCGYNCSLQLNIIDEALHTSVVVLVVKVIRFWSLPTTDRLTNYGLSVYRVSQKVRPVLLVFVCP